MLQLFKSGADFL